MMMFLYLGPKAADEDGIVGRSSHHKMSLKLQTQRGRL